MFLARKLLQGGAATAWIKEIAYQHDQAGVRKQRREDAHGRQQIGFAAAGEFCEKIKKAENLLAPATDGQRQAQTRRKRRAADTIEIFQTDIAQRSRDLFGVF